LDKKTVLYSQPSRLGYDQGIDWPIGRNVATTRWAKRTTNIPLIVSHSIHWRYTLERALFLIYILLFFCPQQFDIIVFHGKCFLQSIHPFKYMHVFVYLCLILPPLSPHPTLSPLSPLSHVTKHIHFISWECCRAHVVDCIVQQKRNMEEALEQTGWKDFLSKLFLSILEEKPSNPAAAFVQTGKIVEKGEEDPNVQPFQSIEPNPNILPSHQSRLMVMHRSSPTLPPFLELPPNPLDMGRIYLWT
jgi:hypothetical protein